MNTQGSSRAQSTRSTTTGKYLLSDPPSLGVIHLTVSALFRFYCQGRTLLIYTLTTLASAIAGSIAPFQPAFNERKNKVGLFGLWKKQRDHRVLMTLGCFGIGML
jgi:hypothetical protein